MVVTKTEPQRNRSGTAVEPVLIQSIGARSEPDPVLTHQLSDLNRGRLSQAFVFLLTHTYIRHTHTLSSPSSSLAVSLSLSLSLYFSLSQIGRAHV